MTVPMVQAWLVAVPLTWLAYAAIQAVLSRSRSRTHMRTYGCQEPPKYAHWDPVFGYDLFKKSAQSIQDGESFSFEQRLFHEYGKTFQANSWGHKKIYTMQPENLQTALGNQFSKFAVGSLRETFLKPFMEKSIFTADGPVWSHSRSLIKPIFQRAQITDQSAFSVHVDRLLALVPQDGSTVDLQPLLKRTFLDSATEFIFGKSTDTLLPEPRLDTERFLKRFDEVMAGIGERLAYGKFLFLRGRETRWHKAVGEVHRVIDTWTEQALSKENDSDGKDAGRTTLVNELAKQVPDRVELRSQLVNVFFPARDTTSIAVADVFFNLARNPSAWDKLREEVLQVAEPLTYGTLKSLKYMRCVINESFRLLSPAGRTWRLCISECILPVGGGPQGKDPILVQPGTEIHIVWWATQRDPDIWGADAEIFRPERWESPDLNLSAWEYMPFLAGPRVCPGQQMVLSETAYLLARFVREFERIENRDPCLEFVEEHRLTMQSRNGVKVGLVPAKTQN